MIRPATPPAGALAQSIPPSARRVLDELGALDAVEGGGLYPNLGNSVRWAGEEPRSERFDPAAAGFHGDRTQVESVLTAVAETSGVRVLTGSARSATETADGWRVHWDGPDGDGSLSSPWLLDATGRHGLVARNEGRTVDRRTTTLAVLRRWRRSGGWPEADRHLTFVESFDTGWAWSVPLAADLRCYTVMIDQRDAELTGVSLEEILDRELERTGHLGHSREGARPEGSAWACPASLYHATSYGRSGLLLLGDAGSFIDPLSSFGVKKALSSGWLAGIVANTALIDPEMAVAAVDFYDRRERSVYRSYRAASLPFFEAAAEEYGTPYWLERASAARSASAPAADPVSSNPMSGHGPAASDPDALDADISSEEVRAAFDRIRTRETFDAVRGTTLRTFDGPGVAGHRIVMETRLATDRHPVGIRYVRGVDLLRVVEAATTHPDVPDGWASYNALGPAVTLPDYLTALSTAVAAGILELSESGA